MRTLYVSDLDGTLLNPNAALTQYTTNILNELIHSGLLFSIATARTASSSCEKTRGLNLTLPIVQLNGVLLFDPLKRAYTDCVPFTYEQSSAVLEITRDFDRVPFVYKYESGEIAAEFECLANSAEMNFFEARKNKAYKRFSMKKHIEISKSERVIYFTMMDTVERLAPIYNRLLLLDGIRTVLYSDNYSDFYFLEIFSSSASKGNGIRRLRDIVNADKLVVFGDNINDLDMFEQADLSIAVANANDEVKNRANLVIGDNASDGVVRYLVQNR